MSSNIAELSRKDLKILQHGSILKESLRRICYANYTDWKFINTIIFIKGILNDEDSFIEENFPHIPRILFGILKKAIFSTGFTHKVWFLIRISYVDIWKVFLRWIDAVWYWEFDILVNFAYFIVWWRAFYLVKWGIENNLTIARRIRHCDCNRIIICISYLRERVIKWLFCPVNCDIAYWFSSLKKWLSHEIRGCIEYWRRAWGRRVCRV